MVSQKQTPISCLGKSTNSATIVAAIQTRDGEFHRIHISGTRLKTPIKFPEEGAYIVFRSHALQIATAPRELKELNTMSWLMGPRASGTEHMFTNAVEIIRGLGLELLKTTRRLCSTYRNGQLELYPVSHMTTPTAMFGFGGWDPSLHLINFMQTSWEEYLRNYNVFSVSESSDDDESDWDYCDTATEDYSFPKTDNEFDLFQPIMEEEFPKISKKLQPAREIPIDATAISTDEYDLFESIIESDFLTTHKELQHRHWI